MPYDGNGNASVTRNIAVTGQTVLAEQVNVPFADIQSMLNQVLLRSGVAPMTGALNMNGFKITGAEDGVAATDLVTLGQLQTATPVGALIDFAGSTAPAGWLLCYGQAISRTTYASLFSVIGTNYGVGDNSTTFNLPDFRGRVGAGLDNMGGTSANRLNNISGGGILGASGGSQTHVLTVPELPSHNHTISDTGHTHNLPSAVPATTPGAIVGITGSPNSIVINQTASATTGITVNNTGSGTAHNNIQPTILINKIIKAS